MGATSRSSSAVWAGHTELKEALDGLATAKGVSATRVKAVAAAAFKYAKDYKRVVHDVEIFIWKADAEHRLAGLYAMDAIMRQSQAKLGAKDTFVKRFLQHMSHTVAALKKIPIDQQSSVAHVIEEWQSRGYYTAEEIEEAGGHEYSVKNRAPSGSTREVTTEAPRPATSVSPSHADPASKAKIASLLSIIKKQKELQEQQGVFPSEETQPVKVEDNRHGEQRRQDRSRSRSRGRDGERGTNYYERDTRLPPDQVSRPQDPSRRAFDDDPRDVKRPRSSRWGPPRPEADATRDLNRPHAIDTLGNRDVDRSSRFESHSPRSGYNGPPGPGPFGPGLPPPPPVGYQGPPPPFRSGPPFIHGPAQGSFPPGAPSPFGPPIGHGHDGGQFNGSFQAPSPSAASASGDQPREICRKFIAGRCTFGDRCWHIHDQSTGDAGRLPPRTELNNPRRKTVLCSNFARGDCRYGDRCSFAHGEDDLDPSVRGRRVNAPSPQLPSPHGSASAQPWAASPHSHSAPNAYDRPPPVTGVAPQFIPPYGSGSAPSQPPESRPGSAGHPGYSHHPPVYGSRPPATSLPLSSQVTPAPTAPWAGAAAAIGYGARGPSPVAQASGRDRALSRDEDEGAGAPEFNLQYDDED